ncbi:hypothetical protein SLA2020_264550 [Shorea laevis]
MSKTSWLKRKDTAAQLIHNFPRISHKELSDATAGFDEQNLIGLGSYGRVYRGVLPDEIAIAVKVLHVQSRTQRRVLTENAKY